MRVVEIIPSQPLGNIIKGTLNFSARQIQELIDLGYQDTLRVLSNKGYRKPGSYNSWSYSYDDYYNSGSNNYYDDDYYYGGDSYYDEDDYYSDDSYYYDNDSYYDEDDYYYDEYSYWYD